MNNADLPPPWYFCWGNAMGRIKVHFSLLSDVRFEVLYRAIATSLACLCRLKVLVSVSFQSIKNLLLTFLGFNILN